MKRILLFGMLCVLILTGCSCHHDSVMESSGQESSKDEYVDTVSLDFTTIEDFLDYIENPEEQKRGEEMTRAAYLDMSEMLPDTSEIYVVILGKNYYLISHHDQEGVYGMGLRVMLLENECDPSDQYDQMRQREGTYTYCDTLSELKTLDPAVAGGFIYHCNGQEIVYIVYQGIAREACFSIGNYYIEVSLDDFAGPYQQAIAEAFLDAEKLPGILAEFSALCDEAGG